jgi:hypothetical protein
MIGHVIENGDLKDVNKAYDTKSHCDSKAHPHVIVKYVLIGTVETIFVQEYEKAFKQLFVDNPPL